MIAGRHSEDYQPLTWVGRVPIYATTLLVIIHVLTMIAVTIAMSVENVHSAPACPWLFPYIFSSSGVLQGFKIWEFFTYAFVNEPSPWFALEMYLLYSFGREVERFIGRRAFLMLYLAMLLIAPAVLTLLAVVNFPASIFPAYFWGSGPLHFGVFVAFVFIYPNVDLSILRIQMKWVAAILLGIYSLYDVAHHLWIHLGVLWLECLCAMLMLRFAGVTNAAIENWLPPRDDDYEDEPRPQRRLPAPKPEPSLHESIDPLLEKISKHGIGSLTKRERQRLEQARDTLLEQDKRQ